MPSGSSSRCRRRPGVLTLARIVATINATIPAAAHEIGSSMTRSSVFTRTVPPSRGCTTLRASSRAVPSWRSARRARSKSISNPITSTSSSIISHSVPACTPSTAAAPEANRRIRVRGAGIATHPSRANNGRPAREMPFPAISLIRYIARSAASSTSRTVIPSSGVAATPIPTVGTEPR